jgi:hypothetical protein
MSSKEGLGCWQVKPSLCMGTGCIVRESRYRPGCNSAPALFMPLVSGKPIHQKVGLRKWS